jgi:hypothetical protein
MKIVGNLPDMDILHSDWAVHGARTNTRQYLCLEDNVGL